MKPGKALPNKTICSVEITKYINIYIKESLCIIVIIYTEVIEALQNMRADVLNIENFLIDSKEK